MFTKTTLALRYPIACAALAAGILASPGVTAAASSVERVVRFTQADLASNQQVAALYGRLQAASRDVCSSLQGRDLTSWKNYRMCYSTALERAVSDVNEQTLTALHNAPGAKSAKNALRAKANSDKQS